MSVDLRFMCRRIHFVAADAVQLSAAMSTKLNPAERDFSIKNRSLKSITFILFCFINNLLFTQDTLVTKSDSINYVEIINNNTKTKIYYEFITDYKIKDGRYLHEFYELKSTCYYKNNQINGNQITTKNNKVISSSTFKNGILNGRFFNTIDSITTCYGRYENGLKVKRWTYKSNNKTIAKGKFSGKFILFKNDGSHLYFILSKGDSVTFETHADYKIFISKYDYFIGKNKNWLRKGKWVYYNLQGEKIKKVYYNNEGQVKRIVVIKEQQFAFNIE